MFLRVGRDRLQCIWEIGFGGELDLLVYSGDKPETVVGLLGGPLAMFRVFEGGDHRVNEPATLFRPLQYEAFVDALLALERQLDANIDCAAGRPPQKTDISPDASYRLKTWPPAALLQGHRYYLRLASCMSVRYVGIEELVRLSNVSREQCLGFLAVVAAHDLVDMEIIDDSVDLRSTSSAQSIFKLPADSPPKLDVGLFAKIRRKLGLTLHR